MTSFFIFVSERLWLEGRSKKQKEKIKDLSQTEDELWLALTSTSMSHKIKDPHHSHVVAVVIYKLLAWTRSKQYLAFAPGSLYLNVERSKSQNIHGFWARDLEKLGRIRSTDSYGYLENTPTHAAHMCTHSHQHTHTLTRTAIYFRRLGFERIP